MLMGADTDLQTTWPSEPAGPPPVRRHPLDLFKELPVLVVLAFALALLMKTFLIQMFFIPSESMVPTLETGDRVAVNKLAYRFREPRRGEVIVFVARPDEREKSLLTRVREFLTDGLGATRPEEEDFIKRIIGLPGETIEVTKKHVFITTTDGERLRLKEPYIRLEGQNFRTFGPFEIPEDTYFVMGDNRNNSSDSRVSFPGPIPRERIIGKAFVKIWPPTRVGTLRQADYDDAKVVPKKKKSGSKAARAPEAAPVVLPLVAGTAIALGGRTGRCSRARRAR